MNLIITVMNRNSKTDTAIQYKLMLVVSKCTSEISQNIVTT